MEDLELHDALQRYVRADGPPAPFTAQSLLAEGRRRQRRRIGFGLGSGSAIAALAVAFTFGLVPVAGGGEELFDAQGDCRWVLPIGSFFYPTSEPTRHPPTGLRGSQTGSQPPTTAIPSTRAATAPSLTGIAASTTATPVSPGPSGEPPQPLWPSVPPTHLRNETDPQRREAMSCFLKKQMLQMLPGMNHVAPSEPPMEVIYQAELDFSLGWLPTYRGRTRVIHNHRQSFIDVRVTPRGAGTRALPGDERTTTPKGYEAYVAHDSHPALGGLLIVDVYTHDSRITISSEGGLLDLDQLFQLADARELDLFR